MPLSKHYTLAKVRSLIRDLANEVAPDKVQDLTITEIINKNTLDIAEMLNGATQPDYGETAVLTDQAASLAEIVASATFTNATKTVTKTAHGLTSADVGKAIMIWDVGAGLTRYAMITTIASITSTSAFTVVGALGVSVDIQYSVLSFSTITYLSLTALKVDKIVKVVCSVNKLVSPRKAFDFENLVNIQTYNNSVFFYQEGEKLYLFKGSGVSAWGTLTVHYYRIPTLVSSDTEYIDLRDKYIPLLLDKCKLEIYELGKEMAPKELQQSVDSKSMAIREANSGKEALLQDKRKG